MKKLFIAAILFAAASAYGTGFLQKDNAQQYAVQGFAPDAKKIQALTVYRSGSIDNRADVAWSVYSPSDCSYRIQSSATRAGTVLTIPGSTPYIRVVHGNSKYTSFSGCTNGQLSRQ